MTQRERQASATEVYSASTATEPLTAGHAAPPHQSSSDAGNHHLPLWEDLYQAASPAQQRELLSLAQRQGLLYAHQLPQASNGTRPSVATEDCVVRQLLPRLLNGHVNDLEPASVPPVTVHDSALDATQREAVARALSTPDLCLIQGLPGTGKSRVVAEIVTQAAAQGWRVLLLAPSAAAIDRVLLLAGSHDAVCPLRCLGHPERLDQLPPSSRALVFSERARSLAEQTVRQAQAAVLQEEKRGQRSRQDEALWPRLEELAGQFQQLEVQMQELTAARSALADYLVPDDDPWVAASQDNINTLRTTLKETQHHMSERRQELASFEPDLETLRPLAEAKQKGRWWTARWWRATFKGNVRGKLAALEDLQKQTHLAIAGLESKAQGLEQECLEVENAFQAERTRRRDTEVARRAVAMNDQDTAIRHELGLVQSKWQSCCQDLAPQTAPPLETTPEAVQAARHAWQRQREQEVQRLAFTREWASHVQETAPTLARRLPGYVNLVAATTAALAGDEHFGDPAAHGGAFDLLILDEADQVTESEFLKLAGRARRWLLVGEPDHEPPTGRQPDSGKEALGATSRPRGTPAIRPGFFQRLWDHLHSNPRKLPYSWVQENERLCCRLRPLSADQRRCLEREHVADFPEIELRILVLPRMQPLLAEVVFPPSMSIQEAKEYIFKELQELPVQAASHSFRWIEEAEQIVFHIADGEAAGRTCVNLEPGIQEWVGPKVGGVRRPAPSAGHGPKEPAEVSWHTCQVEFDRRAGWQRARAEEWVRRHLGVRDLGRTIRLDVPQRMHPPLAAVLSDLLFDGCECCAYRLDGGAPFANAPGKGFDPYAERVSTKNARNGHSFAIEFVPVPPLASERAPRPGSDSRHSKHDNGRRVAVAPPRVAAAKGGAGLELDLMATRHADRLPSELRANLPGRGFVNYLEAQAVVRKLETLAADPGFKKASDPPSHSPVAVLALYEGQAELIRRLIRQSPTLGTGGISVEVDVPGAFRHRESAVVLVSLTRSHNHRAVSFGEGPQALALALTRACARLIVFGDPGTLARRCQWEGPLDHLDEASAARERKLIAQLLRYLQGQGRHSDMFHLCEGSGP